MFVYTQLASFVAGGAFSIFKHVVGNYFKKKKRIRDQNVELTREVSTWDPMNIIHDWDDYELSSPVPPVAVGAFVDNKSVSSVVH